jgi:PilZ domain
MASSTTNSAPSWSALKRKDTRRHRRYEVANTILRVSWLDVKGQLKMAQVKVLNVSEAGMALEMPEAPMNGSMIRFQSEKHKLVGAGALRHCRKINSKFVIGIEFTDGLKWCPPPDSIQEPIPLFDPGPEA